MTAPNGDSLGGELARVRHPDLGEQNVPRSALPILAASGWSEVSKKDTEAAAKAEVEEAARLDREMTEAGLAAIPEDVRPTALAMQVNVADVAADQAADKSERKAK